MRIRYDRLRKLADFLDTLSPSQFDFNHVRGTYRETDDCGTVGCAIGWTPVVFPRLMKFTEGKQGVVHRSTGSDDYDIVGQELFGISLDDAFALFGPMRSLPWLNNKMVGNDATPKQVAKSIRAFIEWKKAGGKL